MDKKKITTTQLAFLAICISLGLICKRLIAPLAGVITDIVRLPGGSITSAFSIMFLLLGVMFVEWKPAATVSGFIQSLIAIGLGLASNQGIFALVTFTVPGIIIDILRMIMRSRNSTFVISTSALANTVCALVSNMAVFHFTSGLLVLWLLIAACFGVVAGVIGSVVYKRMCKVSGFAEIKREYV